MNDISINKDNALQTAGSIAFVTLVVAGTHFLMEHLGNGINSLSTKIKDAKTAKDTK